MFITCTQQILVHLKIKTSQLGKLEEHIYSLIPLDLPMKFNCPFTDSFHHLFIEQTFIGPAHVSQIQK